MTFREALAKIVDGTPGGRAGLIMGSDGIPLDEYRGGGAELDLPTVAVECQRALEEARKVVGAFEHEGDLEELVLQTGRHQILFRPIDDEYFLVIAIDRGGFLGKARFLVASLLHEIREEL